MNTQMPKQPLSLVGCSVAGFETSIEVPSFGLVLDMGRCSRTAVNHQHVLVSHGHLRSRRCDRPTRSASRTPGDVGRRLPRSKTLVRDG
jgi:hypothetical protein